MSRTVLSLWKGRIPVRPTMLNIIEAVAERHDLTVEEIRGPDRSPYVSRPRQEAMWRMIKAGKSLTQIGRFLGGRGHTTILKGARAHEGRMSAAPVEAIGEVG